VGAAVLGAGSTAAAGATTGGPDRPSELGALFDDDATGPVPPGGPPEGGERRRRALMAVFAVLALVVGGLLVSQLLSPGSGSAQTTTVGVPSLTDLSQEQAEAELTRLGLQARVEEVASSRPAGTVIGQEPQAPATVEVGSAVVLRVSSGPGVVSIPDVRGSREQAARTILEQRNVVVAEQVREVIDVELGAGVVAGTDPAAGETVEPGSTVTLVVASGDTEVPDLAGLDSTEAIGLLLDNRLRGQIERRPTSAFTAGTVIEHSPAPGEVVGYGTDVTLVVASTPPAPPPPPPAPEPVAPARPPAPEPQPTPEPPSPTTEPEPSTPPPTTEPEPSAPPTATEPEPSPDPTPDPPPSPEPPPPPTPPPSTGPPPEPPDDEDDDDDEGGG
jgi:beta-lactam-binding protein with PASTA domain